MPDTVARMGFRARVLVALVPLASVACWQSLTLGPLLDDAGSGGATTTGTSVATTGSQAVAVSSVASSSSSSVAATGSGGGGPFMCNPPAVAGHLYSFSAKTLEDPTKSISMCQYRGDVVLYVNTASQCTYTYQYANLQKLATNEFLAPKGFKVLGFISNDYHEAAGTDQQISACNSKYGVTFQQFALMVVQPDPQQHPIFKWLTSQAVKPGPVSFNFNKFLVSRKGVLLDRWDELVEPMDPKIVGAVENAVKEPYP
jgi:glutathione peroxidase